MHPRTRLRRGTPLSCDPSVSNLQTLGFFFLTFINYHKNNTWVLAYRECLEVCEEEPEIQEVQCSPQWFPTSARSLRVYLFRFTFCSFYGLIILFFYSGIF